MEKLMAYFDVLRVGSQVADPVAWKKRQINGTIVAALILALVKLARGYGYEIPVDQETANVIGLAVIAVVNIVLTLATSQKVGCLSAACPADDAPAAGDGGADSAGPDDHTGIN